MHGVLVPMTALQSLFPRPAHSVFVPSPVLLALLSALQERGEILHSFYFGLYLNLSFLFYICLPSFRLAIAMKKFITTKLSFTRTCLSLPLRSATAAMTCSRHAHLAGSAAIPHPPRRIGLASEGSGLCSIYLVASCSSPPIWIPDTTTSSLC